MLKIICDSRRNVNEMTLQVSADQRSPGSGAGLGRRGLRKLSLPRDRQGADAQGAVAVLGREGVRRRWAHGVLQRALHGVRAACQGYPLRNDRSMGDAASVPA